MRLLLRVLIVLSILLSTNVVPSCAQDPASAQVFLQSIYKHYGKGGSGVNFDGPKARLYFSPSLIALVHADLKALGPDQVGVLDGDPLCGCQDWDAVRNLNLAVSPGKPGQLKAAVSFALFGPDARPQQSLRVLEIALVRKGDQWRIDNIVDKSDPKTQFDLRAELKKEIRQAKDSVGATPAPRPTKPRF